MGGGLWPDEAQAVLTMLLEGLDEHMRKRMADDCSAYPASVLAVMCWRARRCAVNWIDANKPRHPVRPFFLDR